MENSSSVVARRFDVPPQAVPDLLTELAAAAAASDHPCAVGIDRASSDPDQGVVIESRTLPGGSLADRAGSPMDSEAVAAGGVRAAAALSFAHSRGVLHGDLRPANVLLDADGRWLIADIGVARALARAEPGVAVTPDPSFAPRELRGWERPAPSADVFSLGAVLHAALAGAPPLPGGGSSATALASVPPAMAALIDRMMAANPADRPSLVEVDHVLRPLVPAAAREALPAAVAGLVSISAPRPQLPIAAAPVAAAVASGRNRVLIAAAAIGAIFLGGATAVAVGNSGRGGGKAVLASASAPPVAVSAAPTSAVPKPSTAAPEPAKKPKPPPAPKPSAPQVVAAPLAAAPAAAPAAPTSVNMRLVTPYEAVLQLADVDGRQKLRVTWKVGDIPPAVSGWKIYVGDLHGSSSQTEGALLDSVAAKPTDKNPYYTVGYTMKGDYPLSDCVVVVTQLGQAAHSPGSNIACLAAKPSHLPPAQKPAQAPAPAKSVVQPATPPKPAAKPTPKH